MSFSILPNELLLSIADELPDADLNTLTRASRFLHQLLTPSLLHRLTLDNTANEVLRWAIATNNVQTVQLALSSGECEFHSDPFPAPSCSCISLAASLGHMEIAKLLIDHLGNFIVDFDMFECHHMPLYYAIERDDIPMTALLLEHGANPNNTGHGMGLWPIDHPFTNPLVVAAANGSAEIAELLMKAGVDVNPDGRVMRMAMQIACRAKNWPYAIMLAKSGKFND